MIATLSRPMEPLRYTKRFVRRIIPLVDREMARWQHAAAAIPSESLRQQALASQQGKRFHAEGGSVFAAACPEHAEQVVRLIVALQTISDYLDNLGDRTESLCEADFRLLHQAMLDAVGTGPPCNDYYAHHPVSDDGGYLASLVSTCREALQHLPGYEQVAPELKRQLGRYCDMQVYKHLPTSEREQRLIEWHRTHPDRTPELEWWEFAAASGSTLGAFALFGEAVRIPSPERIEQLSRAYFPWIAGLHILLDYFIDQEEDQREGDLNFVAYYPSGSAAYEGMHRLVVQALAAAADLPDPGLHRAVIEGLLALYLSDPKVKEQGLRPFAHGLIGAAGLRTWLTYGYCHYWRRKQKREKAPA